VVYDKNGVKYIYQGSSYEKDSVAVLKGFDESTYRMMPLDEIKSIEIGSIYKGGGEIEYYEDGEPKLEMMEKYNMLQPLEDGGYFIKIGNTIHYYDYNKNWETSKIGGDTSSTYEQGGSMASGGGVKPNIAYIDAIGSFGTNDDSWDLVTNILKKHNIEVDNSKDWHTKGYAEELYEERDGTPIITIKLNMNDAPNPQKLKKEISNLPSRINYEFTNDYAKGGKTRSTHSINQDRRRLSQEPWEQAYLPKRKGNFFAKGGKILGALSEDWGRDSDVYLAVHDSYVAYDSDEKAKQVLIEYDMLDDYKHIFDNDENEDDNLVDLFDDYENIPPNIQAILEKYEMEDNDYNTLGDLQEELEEQGYTFDFGLDATPYNLRKMYAKGGGVDSQKTSKYAVIDNDTDRIYVRGTDKDFIEKKYKELKEIYPNSNLIIQKFAKGGGVDSKNDIVYLPSVGTYLNIKTRETSPYENFEYEDEIWKIEDIENDEWFENLSDTDKEVVKKVYDFDKYRNFGKRWAKGGTVGYGAFERKANARGLDVHQFASQVLGNKDYYDSTTVKQAESIKRK
jgi:hypothetical protein